MAATPRPITYTDVEIRSQLPSGWGIVAGSATRWDPKAATWSVDLYDGAANSWTVTVTAAEIAKSGRPAALAARVRQLELKALGRKSVISG